MKKKWMVACLAISCSTFINASENNASGCAEINPQNYEQFMETHISKSIKNPFADNRDGKSYREDSCMTVSYKVHDTPTLTQDDFRGSEKIHNTYTEFMEGNNQFGQTGVTMNYDPDTNQLYTFFKFAKDDGVTSDYSKYWSKNKLLMMHYEDFIFLHELMHTDAETTMKNIDRNEKESIADIAAVMVLQASKDLSPEITYKIMKQLDRARKTKVKINSSRREIDRDHLNRGNFSKALDFFEQLKENDVNLKVASFQEARDIARNIVNHGHEYAYKSVKEKMNALTKVNDSASYDLTDAPSI